MTHRHDAFTVRPQAAARPTLALALISAAVLAACGGGGGDDSAEPPATPAAVTVSGVAATGAALANATVTAHCATGTGTATSNTDGTYTITITGGALPCVLEATDGSTTLHSVVAADASGAVTANITPLTELLVAQMTAGDPAALFSAAASGSASLATVVTSAAVSSAQTAVISTLSAAGIDTASVTNIVSGSLAAGTGTGYDGVLDTLKSTLTLSGTTLTELVTTVATTAAAATSGSATGSTPTTDTSGDTSALPASLLLKPKADGCSALRSGEFRMIVLAASATTGGTDPVTMTEVASFDAPTLTFTWQDGSQSQIAADASNSCHYTLAGAEMVVAPNGVLVARSTNTDAAPAGSARLVLGLPKQSVSVADVAGKWNVLSWERTNGVYAANSAIATVGSDGALTGVACDGQPLGTAEASCNTSSTLLPKFSANADGGLDLSGTDPTDPWTDRAFGYRDGTGRLMMVSLSPDGSFNFLTPYRTLTGQTVGNTQVIWNAQVNSQSIADALSANRHEVTNVANDGSFTRTTTNLTTNVSHPQTLQINSPRNGLIYRAAATPTGSDGSTVTVREMFTLRLGPGLSAYYLPATGANNNSRMALAVTRP